MSYALYGSKTSPFVRRIRLLMESIPYTFKEMNIFEGPDAAALRQINPINQIPVLTDGDLTVWDSRQIFNYLNAIHKIQNLDWQDENLLTAIDGAMNAGVSVLLMKRSGIDTTSPLMYVQRQKDRMESILDYIEPLLTSEPLDHWNFHSMSLYCFLDWAIFRELINLKARPTFLAFLETHHSKAIVVATQIPKV